MVHLGEWELSVSESAIVHCGGSTPKALERFANFIADHHVKRKEPVPPSPFINHVADLICGGDRKDYSLGVVGKKGSGKSRTALSIAERLSIEIANRLGGAPCDYFDPRLNVLTLDDVEAVARRLSEMPKHSVIIIDDAGVTVSNRSSMTIANRNLLAISTVMRTRRCCAIYTMVSAETIDVGIRNLLDAKIFIYKSCHSDGFNICKVLIDGTTLFGKRYSSKLTVDKTKIDYWAVFSPSPEIVEVYEKEREASADRLIERTVLSGRFDKKLKPRVVVGVSKTVTEDAKRLEIVGDKLRSFMKENPNASMNKLCSVTGYHHCVTSRLAKLVREGKQ